MKLIFSFYGWSYKLYITLHYIIISYILGMKKNIFKHLIYNFFVCLYILTGKFPKGFIIIFNIAIDYLKMLLWIYLLLFYWIVSGLCAAVPIVGCGATGGYTRPCRVADLLLRTALQGLWGCYLPQSVVQHFGVN